MENNIDNSAASFNSDFGDYVRQAETDDALNMMDSVAGTVSDKNPETVNSDYNNQNALSGNLTDTNSEDYGIGRDISVGILNSPRSAARGAVKGVNNMIGVLQDIADFAPAISFIDEEGSWNIKPDITTVGEVRKRTDKMISNKTGKDFKSPELSVHVPDKPAVSTVTGNVIEGISQFLVGFKGADKLVKLAGSAGKISTVINNPAVKGTIADMLAFDSHEERLSNLVQSVPALQNPVTEYLAAAPEDSKAEAKLKQAVEGLATNAATEALVKGISLVKRGKAAVNELKASGKNPEDIFDNLPPEEKAGIGINDRDFDFLGKADDDNLLLRKQQKLDTAQDEVNAAFGKTKSVSDKPSQPIDDYKINFARINAPDDITRLMDDMVNNPALKPSIEAERRGTRTNTDTLQSAQDIDGFDALMARRTGDAYNAEYIVAARRVYYETTDKLMEAAQRAAGPTASDIDRFNFQKMVATHQAVQKEFMGVRAEAGRALQAWSIPIGSGAEKARAVTDMLNETGGSEVSQYLAQKLAGMADKLNTTQINAIITKSAGARTLDAVAEAWTLGLLTNPTTHVVNIGDTMLTGLWLGAERLASAGFKESPIDIREGYAFFNGWIQAHKMALKNSADALRSGEVNFGIGKAETPRIRATAKDVLDPNNKAGWLSDAVNGYGYVLQRYASGFMAAGDSYNKTLMYQAQTYALATRDGIARGMEGAALKQYVAETLQNVPSVMKADAVEFANYATYTKRLGQTGSDIKKIIAKNPYLKFIAPFVNTADNIFKFTFERTPLAYLSKNIRDDIAAGGARAVTAKTRIAMGTAFMAMGVDLAMNGHITGNGPVDPDVRAALRRTGWQPNSVKIGDTYYSFSRFGYLGTALGIAADTAEILTNYEAYDIDVQSETDKLAVAGAIAVSNQVMGKTFMSGAADLVQTLSDPGRYGEGYAARIAASFVPSGVAAVERAINPEMSAAFNMIDDVKSRIPGLSATVPVRRNIWGEPIAAFYPDRDSVINSSAERLLSLVNPVYYSSEKDAPVDRWMLKNGFEINMPQKVQEFDGVRIDLRDYPAAYSRLTELRGDGVKLLKYGNQTMKEFFHNLASETDPYGRHLGFFLSVGNSFDEQQNFINKVVTDYTEASREQVLSEFPDIDIRIGKERRNGETVGKVRKSIQNMINGGTQ